MKYLLHQLSSFSTEFRCKQKNHHIIPIEIVHDTLPAGVVNTHSHEVLSKERDFEIQSEGE